MTIIHLKTCRPYCRHGQRITVLDQILRRIDRLRRPLPAMT